MGDNEVDLITRRQIADDVRHLADDRPLFVLNQDLQTRVKKFAQFSYGIKRVILTLKDGNRFDASIAWDRHIVFVRGYGLPPFDAAAVIDVTEVLPGETLDSEP